MAHLTEGLWNDTWWLGSGCPETSQTQPLYSAPAGTHQECVGGYS